MKEKAFAVFKILAGGLAIVKISDLFLGFGQETNGFLKAAMFCLIGLAYCIIGVLWDKKLSQLIIVSCGGYLISMNFLDKSIFLHIAGIICLLTPLLIARYLPAEQVQPNE